MAKTKSKSPATRKPAPTPEPITALSEAQWSRVDATAKRVRAAVLGAEPADQLAAESAVRDAYALLGKKPPTRVIWMRSPLGGMLVASALARFEGMETSLCARFHREVYRAATEVAEVRIAGELQREVEDRLNLWDLDVFDILVPAHLAWEPWEYAQIYPRNGPVRFNEAVHHSVGEEVADALRRTLGDEAAASVRKWMIDSATAVRSGEPQGRWAHTEAGHYAGFTGCYQLLMSDARSLLGALGIAYLARYAALRPELGEGPDVEPLFRFGSAAGCFLPFEDVVVITDRPAELHFGSNVPTGAPRLIARYRDGWSLHAQGGEPTPVDADVVQFAARSE